MMVKRMKKGSPIPASMTGNLGPPLNYVFSRSYISCADNGKWIREGRVLVRSEAQGAFHAGARLAAANRRSAARITNCFACAHGNLPLPAF